ncbi:hypothetical protein C8R46DRAFT_1035836 [Mycena filopes]|nr:hypothetical protein C8R46DRAFT_1035836 [Mycena filopes]
MSTAQARKKAAQLNTLPDNGDGLALLVDGVGVRGGRDEDLPRVEAIGQDVLVLVFGLRRGPLISAPTSGTSAPPSRFVLEAARKTRETDPSSGFSRSPVVNEHWCRLPSIWDLPQMSGTSSVASRVEVSESLASKVLSSEREEDTNYLASKATSTGTKQPLSSIQHRCQLFGHFFPESFATRKGLRRSTATANTRRPNATQMSTLNTPTPPDLFQRLPGELLDIIIVERFIGDPPRDGHMPSIASFLQRRYTASFVARSWRTRARESQRLWAITWIFRFSPLPFLAFSLGQAASRPLDVVVDCKDWVEVLLSRFRFRRVKTTTLPDFFQRLSSACSSSLHRVEHLRLFSAHPDDWLAILCPFQAAPLVTLEAAVHPGYHANPVAVLAAPASWNLQRLMISGYVPNWTVLDEVPLELDLLLAILHDATNLSTLDLGTVTCEGIPRVPRLRLLALTHLRFTMFDEEQCIALLYSIEMPALRGLDDACTPFLPHLRELELQVVVGGCESFPGLLAGATNLEYLDVRGCSDEMWGSIHVLLLSGTYQWPNLTSLWVEDQVADEDLLVLLQRQPPRVNEHLLFIVATKPSQGRTTYFERRRVDEHIVGRSTTAGQSLWA